MKMRLCKTGEIIGSSYVKVPVRSKAILNIESFDRYCFIRSILAYLHPCESSHPSRVRINIQYFNEKNIDGIVISIGFKCSDKHRFEKLNNLSKNIIELNFLQDGNKWKHNLNPTEISKTDETDRVVDLLIYKNHHPLIEKVNDFFRSSS